MKKGYAYFSKIPRRSFYFFLLATFFSFQIGCSTFSSGRKERISDFDDGRQKKNEENHKNVFASERTRQSQLSEYMAQTGRSSREKKNVSTGDTFLLSDKAKEIYANTER